MLQTEIEKFADIYYTDISHLEGKILTIIDASFSDSQQRKAVKDLVRETIWFRWAADLPGLVDKDIPVGIPII